MVDLNVMAVKIKEVLEKVPGIQQAFDHEPQEMSILPAATVYFDGFSQIEATTRRSSVDWRWTIRVYIPIQTSDIQLPQTEVRNLAVKTIKQFRNDMNLGGSCLYSTISAGEIYALLEQNNPNLVAELQLVTTTEE
ncbi:hypothetical protein [Bacillus sp. UNC322MFChir4.1]|uniref:hypothetical protein n=1 Tax=Bacillus sp. UNC322MFChir4.1 TaxID=1449045 RepID=UPI000554CCB9|nr:hypothetical protein [Bacillus sp. UNC322MFChir4.1]